MKKSLLVISVILLIAGLFISCNSEAAESGEDLVYVKFADEGKGLSTVIAPFGGESATPIGNLYWYYQATKNGGAQQGATNGWTRVNNSGKGLSGTLGPFSVGSWTFTLKGCNDEAGNDIVYNGTTGETPIKLKRGTNYINVTLSWNNAPEAPTTTSFNWNVTYSADYSGTLYYRVTAKVGDTVTALNDGNSNSATITDGSISISGSKNNFSITDEFTPITVKFEVYSEAPVDNVYDEDVKVAENSVTFPGLKGGTATITGTLDDLGSAYVVINEPSTPEGIPASAISGVNSDTVAYIIKEGTMHGYASLADAVNAAVANDTICLLKNVVYDDNHSIDVWAGDFDLNLNGHTISTYSVVGIELNNNGYTATAVCYGDESDPNPARTVTVSNGVIRTAYGAGIYADGPNLTLNIDNVDVRQDYPIHNQSTSEYSSAVRLTTNARVNINSGSFYGHYSVAVSNSGGNVSINGGTFSAPLFFSTGGTTSEKSITIEGGTFTATSVATFVKNSNKGTLTIHGGTFYFDPTDLLPSGYTATPTGSGTWTVATN